MSFCVFFKIILTLLEIKNILYGIVPCRPQVRYTQLVRQKRRKPAGRSMGGVWRGTGSVSEGRLGARGGSRRSGYAFAHQEGFGELITSGKNMRLSSLGLASFASRHSTGWIDTLRRKKNNPTPPGTSGENSPALSIVSGSVPPLSNSSSVLGGSQETPIEEEAVTAPAQNTDSDLAVCKQTSTSAVSEAATPHGSAQANAAGVSTSIRGRPHVKDSSGGWAHSLGTVQVSHCLYWTEYKEVIYILLLNSLV